MSIIHITTDLIAKNQYELSQVWVVGEINVDERTFIETHEDRMFAAMTNLGYACKWFADKNFTRGDICIVTDTDGKDQRYNGEHDDLFEAVRSGLDYRDNRAKYALIYGKYVKYLDRIRELADTYEIGFTQQESCRVAELQSCRVEESVLDADNPYLIQNQNWTRDNILHLSLKGQRNIVTCRACQRSISYNQTDNFIPVRLQDAKGHKVLIRSNKQLVKNFQEVHLGLHLNYNESIKTKKS